MRELLVAPQGVFVLDGAGRLRDAENPAVEVAAGIASHPWIAQDGLVCGIHSLFSMSGSPFGVNYWYLRENGIRAGTRVLLIEGESYYRDNSGISSQSWWSGGALAGTGGSWGTFRNHGGTLRVVACPQDSEIAIPMSVPAMVGPDLAGGIGILWKQAGVLHRAGGEGTEMGQVPDTEQAVDLCAVFAGQSAVVLRVRSSPSPRTLTALRWSAGGLESTELPGAVSDSWLASPPVAVLPPAVAVDDQSFAVLVGANWPTGTAAPTCSIVEIEPGAADWVRATPFPSPTGAPSVIVLDPVSVGDPRYAALVPMPDGSSEIRFISCAGDGSWVSDLAHATIAGADVRAVRAGRSIDGPAVSWVEVRDGGEYVGRYSKAAAENTAAVDGWALW